MEKGLEQSITQMSVAISSVIDELNLLNEDQRTFTSMMSNLLFLYYEKFAGYYMLLTYNITEKLFKEFYKEELNHIYKKLSYLIYCYVVVTVFLIIFLIYFIYNFKNFVNSLFNFIAIIPVKYISEDESFFKEIINLGKNYF